MTAWIVIAVVIVGLAALAGWRRRGRSDQALLPDQRRDLSEQALRQRSRGRY